MDAAFDLTHRRRMLDEETHILTVLIGVADPFSDCLDGFPSINATPEQARWLAANAERVARIVRGSSQGLYASRIAGRIETQAQYVTHSADALDRAIRAASPVAA